MVYRHYQTLCSDPCHCLYCFYDSWIYGAIVNSPVSSLPQLQMCTSYSVLCFMSCKLSSNDQSFTDRPHHRSIKAWIFQLCLKWCAENLSAAYESSPFTDLRICAGKKALNVDVKNVSTECPFNLLPDKSRHHYFWLTNREFHLALRKQYMCTCLAGDHAV